MIWRIVWQAEILTRSLDAHSVIRHRIRLKMLIAGHNGVYICDECVEICSDILDEEFETEADEKEVVDGMNINLLKPKQIKNFLMIML